MGKIIVIKGADFSEVRVGVVDIPTDPNAITPIIPKITLKTSSKKASLQTGVSGLSIKYSLDGNFPNLDYIGEFDVPKGSKIQAVSINGYGHSSTIPEIEVSYSGEEFSFSTSLEGDIKYTTDGTEPIVTSSNYNNPLLAENGIYKAAVFKNGQKITNTTEIIIQNESTR